LIYNIWVLFCYVWYSSLSGLLIEIESEAFFP
jgi:hypothetical protein